ncbi:hypothetical protein NAG16_18570, partial [Pseudomonas aeruginosa]|nr:hypothetical protein [Pseudomonas aeruginosa]
ALHMPVDPAPTIRIRCFIGGSWRERTGYPEKSLSVTTTIFVVVKKINPRKAFREAIAPRREREEKTSKTYEKDRR